MVGNYMLPPAYGVLIRITIIILLDSKYILLRIQCSFVQSKFSFLNVGFDELDRKMLLPWRVT